MTVSCGNKIKFLFAGLLFIVLLCCLQIHSEAAWVENSNGTYSWYSSKGKLARNKWIKNKYYVDKHGERVTGKKKIDGKYYYFDKSTGELVTKSWIKSGSKYYYARKSGALYTSGKHKVGSSYYYFSKEGVRKTGLKTISGKSYYFDKDSGKMVKKKWVCINGKYYYFGKNGDMKKSRWVGKRYVNSKGVSYTGLHKISGKYYYFDKSTRKKITSTTKTVKGVTYKFNSKGVGKVVEDTTKNSRSKTSLAVESTYYTDPVVSDEDLLAALIWCEAGNQSYEGQLAVGYVVTNRKYSSSFPNTIAKVIYQKGQFTTSSNGSGYPKLTKAIKNGSATSSCKKAAAEVLSKAKKGSTPKITVNGKSKSFPYLYFVTPAAYKSCKLTASYLKIGGHYFLKKWK